VTPWLDHLGRDVDAGFARNEDDVPPIAPSQPRQVMAPRAEAAHDLHLKEANQSESGICSKVPRLEDTYVVDEDVYLGASVYQFMWG
jgi:hypothetical protein